MQWTAVHHTLVGGDSGSCTRRAVVPYWGASKDIAEGEVCGSWYAHQRMVFCQFSFPPTCTLVPCTDWWLLLPVFHQEIVVRGEVPAPGQTGRGRDTGQAAHQTTECSKENFQQSIFHWFYIKPLKHGWDTLQLQNYYKKQVQDLNQSLELQKRKEDQMTAEKEALKLE